MPGVRHSLLIEEIHGTLYDVVFKRSSKGNMIVTKRPDMSRVKWGPAQKAQRERFKRAKTTRLRRKRARDVAMSDYFKGKDLLAKK